MAVFDFKLQLFFSSFFCFSLKKIVQNNKCKKAYFPRSSSPEIEMEAAWEPVKNSIKFHELKMSENYVRNFHQLSVYKAVSLFW